MASKTPSGGMDIYIVWEFIKALSTPFNQTKAFELGLIDKDGKSLKKAQTRDEKKAMTYFDKLIFNLKRIMDKFGFKSKSSIYALSVLLLKEENLHLKSEEEIVEMLEEEIANATGAAVTGTGSDGVHWATPKKRGRPKVMGRYINGVHYLKRTARKTFKERLKNG